MLSSVIRGLIAQALGDLRRIDDVHVRMIIDLVVAGTTGASLDLPRDLVVRRRRDTLRFETGTRAPVARTVEPHATDAPTDEPHATDAPTDVTDFSDVELPVPGIARWGDWRFETAMLEGRAVWEDLKDRDGCGRRSGPDDAPAESAGRMRLFIEQLRQTDPEGVEYLDADRVEDETLVVRRRRPGDRLTPLGSPGRRKLKDYLISRHVPRSERDFVPIIAAAGRVLVVVGLGLDDGVALSDNTRRILKITAVHETTRGSHDSGN